VSRELANIGRLKELEHDIRYRTAFFHEQLKDLGRRIVAEPEVRAWIEITRNTRDSAPTRREWSRLKSTAMV
jgi:hypothetical protein